MFLTKNPNVKKKLGWMGEEGWGRGQMTILRQIDKESSFFLGGWGRWGGGS